MALLHFRDRNEANSIVVKYNDRYFRIILCAVAAHIIVMYKEPDTFFQAILTLSYLIGFAGSFLIALLLTSLIYYVTVRLDRLYDWKLNTLHRLLWQAVLGFAFPAILAFLLAGVFFWLFGFNIFRTTYLQEEYTIILLMLLVMNIYYFGINSFLLRDKRPETEPNDTTTALSELVMVNNQVLPSASKELIIVDTPTKSIPVKQENICYCYLLHGYVFMRTIGMESLNESYQLSGNLKTLEESLDKKLFFRINRQMIVSLGACRSYQAGKNKTIELHLEPLPYPAGAKVPREHKRLCVISEDRAAAFKVWIQR